jgi:hypothetical protein
MGVPSRGAVLIEDQLSLRGSTDIVGWISRVTVAFVCRLWILFVGGWMSVSDAERHIRIKDSQVELDRFGNQAATILALVLTLTGVIYAILMQVLL